MQFERSFRSARSKCSRAFVIQLPSLDCVVFFFLEIQINQSVENLRITSSMKYPQTILSWCKITKLCLFGLYIRRIYRASAEHQGLSDCLSRSQID